MTIILGIESTAHTFGVGIVKDWTVIANEKHAYTTTTGGIHPVKASDHHVDNAIPVLKSALAKAGIKIQEVDTIAFSQGPGLGPCLSVGAFLARYLSLKYNKPLIGVNHCIAHLEIGRGLTKTNDPVLLYASGANTQIIAYQEGKYRVFGETLDTGVGNMIDTFARHLGLGFPGGPKIQELASKGKKLLKIPYSIKGMDVSFSGILTHIERIKNETTEDICFSLQETVFAMLVEASERALAHTDKTELVLCGGVACNKRLQEMCKIMCEERGAICKVPPNEFLLDNGAMIAWQGAQQYEMGKERREVRGKKKEIGLTLEQSQIKPYERTDDVEV